MKLTRILRARGGWCHRGTLLDDGWTSRRILAARRAEGIDLVRRQWLALPDAPIEIREAARVGGVATCVSVLGRFGLWVPTSVDRRPHIALPHNGALSPADAVSHRARPIITRPPRRLVDPIENVLAHVATCLPYDDAFAIWESAIRAGLLSVPRIQAIPWRSVAARRLAADVGSLSDSGFESTFLVRGRRAGFRIVQQYVLAGRPVDALVDECVVVQLDGFAYHSDPQQRRADIAHDREVMALGYPVLRFAYHDVFDDWERVEHDIRRAKATAPRRGPR
ncbi:endonuclease domain-containing protein [Microbacterium karelineae]|uniref:endonuclease domain-containing protein n=1 Tax=Microbacterium karelineae TaxID=2654283 RepID=UPI0018D3FB16|nr:DUF559 domain-containing protein [Microbacterium karelineae]